MAPRTLITCPTPGQPQAELRYPIGVRGTLSIAGRSALRRLSRVPIRLGEHDAARAGLAADDAAALASLRVSRGMQRIVTDELVVDLLLALRARRTSGRRAKPPWISGLSAFSGVKKAWNSSQVVDVARCAPRGNASARSNSACWISSSSAADACDELVACSARSVPRGALVAAAHEHRSSGPCRAGRSRARTGMPFLIQSQPFSPAFMSRASSSTSHRPAVVGLRRSCSASARRSRPAPASRSVVVADDRQDHHVGGRQPRRHAPCRRRRRAS